jgi:3'-phosphoadenosine 5'-phosphosulfate sulfotransferase (PAPS reductase)/FAD synthetase
MNAADFLRQLKRAQQPFKVVASISGGKDSGAMSLWLREQGIEHTRIFCDTGWEHPDTYAYIRETLEPAIGRIEWLRADITLNEDTEILAKMFESRLGHYSAFVRLVLKKMMFPSRQVRFCTEDLKVMPIMRHLAPMAAVAPWMVINAVGIRGSESIARAQLPEWEKSNMGTVKRPMPAWTWRPLHSWSSEDVVAIHKRHGLRPNPLYLRGASRVGCWPCIHARKAEIALVGQITPAQIDIIAELERLLTEGARTRAIRRGALPFPEGLDEDDQEVEEQRRDPDHGRNQRTFFGTGNKGRGWDSYDVKTTLTWAKTPTRGVADPLEQAAMDGCMRWGVCDTSVDPES